MSNVLLPGAIDEALEEMRRRSRFALYRRDPEAWVADVLGKRWWSKQAEIAHSYVEHQRTAIKSANGTGKALSLDTPLPTPTGWTTMGDVTVGDTLLDERGQPTRVVAKSEVWHEDTYRVMFDDGTHVDCAAQHEWNVIDLRARPKRAPLSDWRDYWSATQTYETRELAESVSFKGQWRWRVPLNRPLDLPEAALPVDPYVMGAWLGDGNSRAASITTHPDDQQILDKFTSAGYDIRKCANKYSWSFADNGVFVAYLRSSDLWRNKHIPMEYLRSSVEQRRELLRGLLDTDGHIDARGLVTLDLCSEPLARGVVELVRSLGGRVTMKARPATLYGRVVGVRYRMSIRVVDFNPFYLARKAVRWSPPVKQASRHTQKTIIGIERIESAPTQCVQVDSPRHLFLAGESMVPTHNSFLVADLVCHYVTTHDIGDVIAIVSAPTLAQIELVVFAYLKQNYGLAQANNALMPGSINESLEWKAKTPSGILHMAVGRKPQDQDIVGSFQGIRREKGTGVFIDEAGSVPRDLFVAAEAVTTGSADHKIVAIGNPDLRGTQFQEIFTNPELGKHWNTHTISAFDLPTFTGEIVYEDPAKQEAMLNSGMQDPATVEVWRATWGEDSARYQSKVLGEFPDEADNTFFSQAVINKALETEIDPAPGTPVVLGVDVALGGQDETKIYTNIGGKIRLHTTIQKMNEYDGAFAIHRIALEVGAAEVRVDAAGTGHGVYTNLCALPDFAGAPYTVIGIQGGHASPDRARWNNARSWHYDQLREQMLTGKIDLDLLDKDLQKELMVQTFDYNNLGGIQITPKLEQRKKGLKSPDHLDAVVYSAIDLGYLSGPQPGDKVRTSADEVIGSLPTYLTLMGRW